MESVIKENIKVLNCDFCSHKLEKFKSSSIKVNFTMNKKDVDIEALILLKSLLVNGCKDYPSSMTFTAYLEELYGSYISSSISISGDEVSFSITSKFISDFYSEKGLSDKIVNIMSKVIYEPNFKNNKFEKSFFEFEKEKLIVSRTNEIQKKESYGIMAFNSILEKEYDLLTTFSNIKEMHRVNISRVMDMYHLLINSPYVILVAGDLDMESVKSSFIQYFKKSSDRIDLNIVNQLDKKVKNKIEKTNKFSQSFLISLYKVGTTTLSEDEEFYTTILYSAYLNDRLFDVVREKHNLCYFINNSFDKTTGTFRILTGIDYKNYRKTLSLINKEIEKIKKGNIPNKHWKKIVESVTGSYMNAEDNLSIFVTRLGSYYQFDKYRTATDIIDIINKIKKEDIIPIANRTENLTSYLLKGIGTGGENNA